MRELENEVAERKRAEEAIRDISARLHKVQDEERRRMARELHDSTVQRLAAIVMNLGLLEDAMPGEDSKARKILAGTVALAEQCSQELRTLSYLLHPPLLDQLGLVSALRSYVDGFSARSGIRVSVDAPEDMGRLPGDVELALFRVVQESLGNVHRHSGGGTVKIRLTRAADRLTLEVNDDGRGIPSETLEAVRKGVTAGYGVGIAGMRERMRLVDGSFEIRSGPNGTAVRATVPLTKLERDS
jgi:two-component system, NarL family, sensor kinase